MSFYEQERALFDLLFDAPLREQFCCDGISALSAYGLSEQEKNDFTVLRPDALQMDATMRSNLILAQWCRSYPLSFSLLSSFSDGFTLLRQQINSALMQSAPIERPALFGQQLIHRIDKHWFSSAAHYQAAMQIMEAETAMSLAMARRKYGCLNAEPVETAEPKNDWLAQPLQLADDVISATLPARYEALKKALCPVTGSALWPHLKNTPLPASLRDALLDNNEPQLLLAKAIVRNDSRCDPQTDIVTAELSAGFIPVFQHINGSMSCNELLAHLQHAGAGLDLLRSVQKQLQQLLQTGFLQVLSAGS